MPEESSSMKSTIYFDTEFTDLQQPKLLSLGMVTLDGEEHYVELDPADPDNAGTFANASSFVWSPEVLGQWHKVPGATVNLADMGDRTARWVLAQAARFGQPADLAFDYADDFSLFEALMRGAGHWHAVSRVIRPVFVGDLVSRFDAHLGAEIGFEYASRRGLERHHALADAHGLRTACYAATTGKRMKL